MTHVSILGAGSMGSAIADVVKRGGNTVEVYTSSDTDKPVTGDIVVLAVPYGALADVVAQRSDQLAGKVVVDITNPVDFATFDGLVVPSDASATTELAAALPRSRVVKAFNTNFAATLASGSVGDVVTTVLLAGDDDSAKSLLADVVTAGGLRAIDSGPSKRARELEALAFLQISLAARDKLAWTGGFAVAA
jgi:NADPH-dependent F420 reductase